jgi:hypothetical protein
MSENDSPATNGMPPAKQPDLSTYALSLSAVCLTVGVLGITAALCLGVIPLAFNAPPINVYAAAAIGAAGLLLLALGLTRLPSQVAALEATAEEQPEPIRSTRLYGFYLVGVGFALLLQASISSMVFASISWSRGRHLAGMPSGVTPAAASGAQTGASSTELAKLFGGTPEESTMIFGLFALSSLVAFLGALFFFANALYTKMGEPERDPFDRRVFWGGLWFRIGEAVLFNLVFFLVFRYYRPDSYLLLPLVSLLIGMFLKTGESLISGIATRLFASIQALVPATIEARKVMKLAAFVLIGLPPAPPDAKALLDSLAAGLKGLKGVEQVEADLASQTIRIEYDTTTVGLEDLQRKVELKGLKIRP